MKRVRFIKVLLMTLIVWQLAIFLGGGMISLALLNSSLVLNLLIPLIISVVLYAFCHQADQIKVLEARLKKLEGETGGEENGNAC